MLPNPQFPADLVTFTEEPLNGKLYFLCSAVSKEQEHNGFKSQQSYVDHIVDRLFCI